MVKNPKLTVEQVDEQAVRLRRLMTPWIARFNLNSWDIIVEVTRGEGKLDVSDGPMNGTAADCLAEWEYERASIRFAGPYIANIGDQELTSHIVHELLHCVMDEGKIKRKHEEHIVVRLTRAYMDMYTEPATDDEKSRELQPQDRPGHDSLPGYLDVPGTTSSVVDRLVRHTSTSRYFDSMGFARSHRSN